MILYRSRFGGPRNRDQGNHGHASTSQHPSGAHDLLTPSPHPRSANNSEEEGKTFWSAERGGESSGSETFLPAGEKLGVTLESLLVGGQMASEGDRETVGESEDEGCDQFVLTNGRVSMVGRGVAEETSIDRAEEESNDISRPLRSRSISPSSPRAKGVSSSASTLAVLAEAEDELSSTGTMGGRVRRLRQPVKMTGRDIAEVQDEDREPADEGNQTRGRRRDSTTLARRSMTSKVSSHNSRMISATPSTSSVGRSEQRSRAEGTRSVASVGATVTSAGDWQTNMEPEVGVKNTAMHWIPIGWPQGTSIQLVFAFLA